MFINKDSIMIDGISMGQYLTEVEYSYNKLWGSDSGRNLNGDQSGTLIGIFPKLVLQFRKLSQNELELLTPIFDRARQTVSYYDPTLKRMNTMFTYTGDYEISNKNIINGNKKNEGFKISFISVSRR